MTHLKLVVDNIADPSAEWWWSPNNPELRQMFDDDAEIAEALEAEFWCELAPVLVDNYDARGLVARQVMMKRRRQWLATCRGYNWDHIKQQPKCEVTPLGA